MDSLFGRVYCTNIILMRAISAHSAS